MVIWIIRDWLKTKIDDDNELRLAISTREAENVIDEIDRLTALVERLKEDGERLASTYVIEVFPHEWVCRGGCHHWARFGEQIEHSPDCPITLHRALMKELEADDD